MKKNKITKVQESKPVYGKPENSVLRNKILPDDCQADWEKNTRIYIYHSFEEQENDNYQWLASLTPEQHLINGTKIIKRIFADQLALNPNIGTQITFE